MLLPNTSDKNNPKETYIAEDTKITDNGYMLISKLGVTLRNKLYKVHPDEIILAPILHKKSHGDPSEENIHPKIQSGRPLRCAAMNKQYVSNILSGYTRTQTYKHGWIHLPLNRTYLFSYHSAASDDLQPSHPSKDSKCLQDVHLPPNT